MIHISTARKIFDKGEFSVSFLTARGECRHVEHAVSLKWDFHSGTRTIKCIPSGEIRRVRDAFIIAVNDEEVYF